ncbi:transporter substrate-binding domain-containing protein, partial [Cetobacterium sp.]|uniref:transporter substrate-binding domain-containing protein n=3 Tax=Cetobacterium sp. TaxID=2071632 RepID=UPI002FCC3B62
MKKIIMLIMVLLFVVFMGCTKDEKKDGVTEKVYVVGTNAEYPPYEYLENNKVVGLDADIIEELSKRVGFNYKWSNMNFDGLISALQAKKVDMVIAGMTVTEERKNFINFSTPYIAPNICYIVLKNNNLKNSNELQNKKFGVELGTTEEGIARQVPGAQV